MTALKIIHNRFSLLQITSNRVQIPFAILLVSWPAYHVNIRAFGYGRRQKLDLEVTGRGRKGWTSMPCTGAPDCEHHKVEVRQEEVRIGAVLFLAPQYARLVPYLMEHHARLLCLVPTFTDCLGPKSRLERTLMLWRCDGEPFIPVTPHIHSVPPTAPTLTLIFKAIHSFQRPSLRDRRLLAWELQRWRLVESAI